MTAQTLVNTLFAHGRAIDGVLAVLCLEMVVGLCLLGRRGAKLDLMFALAPGFLLMLALRSALAGDSYLWVALFLAASFPIHLIDLVRRRVWSRHAP
jgi:hypothetical protein